MLNAVFYVGVTKLSARLECSKSAAILYALNEGLKNEEVISQEDHDLLKQRYGRKLKDVIAEGKENSHISKLELERRKRIEKLQAAFQIVKPEDPQEVTKNILKGKYEQWDSHPDSAWRIKTIAYAKKYPENEHSKLIIAKETKRDIISQSPTEGESAI